MRVGKSVQKAIDEWEQGDLECAMLHACNAVDGTSKKLFPNLGNKDRFTRFLRDSYPILGPLAAPGIDLVNTRFPISVPRPKAVGGKPDFADLIYGIHRCSHGHGDELPDGFDLIPDVAGPAGYTRMAFGKGVAHLSDRSIFGLIGVSILSPVNVDQKIPENYFLTFGSDVQIFINNWWGRSVDFIEVINSIKLISVKLDFGDWMDGV